MLTTISKQLLSFLVQTILYSYSACTYKYNYIVYKRSTHKYIHSTGRFLQYPVGYNGSLSDNETDNTP